MSSSELWALPISEVSPLIARRTVSVAEVCRAYVDRIRELDPVLNCYITLADTTAAIERADRDLSRGRNSGPLHGIPVGIKDNLATAGIKTTGGIRLTREWVPAHDAASVERLKAAGAIVIGKLNLHELAYGATTVNPTFGATLNPWNLAYTPAGSSGGSGAAVAAGLAAASLGGDAAGSIRAPAMACGVVGLKPTFGRVSRYGLFGGPQSTVDHIGPITRTVRDAALVLRAISGHDARDPSTAKVEVPDFAAHLDAGVDGLTIGIPYEQYAPLSAEVKRLHEDAIAVLRTLGIKIQEVQLPHAKVEYTDAMLRPILYAEGQATRLASLLGAGVIAADALSPDIARQYRLARLMPSYLYVNAQKARRVLIREFDAALRGVDAIVTPMSSVPVQTRAEADAGVVTFDGRQTSDLNLRWAFGIPYNLTGMPALSVPCGFFGTGVPAGLQIAGRPFDEVTVLRIAYAYESATPWREMHPPLDNMIQAS